MPPVVCLRGVSKCYGVYDSPLHSMMGMVAPKMVIPREVWALREIDLVVERGECLGIIGRNGSGKSTLLRVVGGIVSPTSGEVQVNGRISTLLDLTVGMQQELTGRANIKILGGLLGLSDEEIVRRTDRIVEFADLGEAMDRPVKTYSTGMSMRLGFAIALHTDFDIFLVDEVLAVGDSNFHRKCINKLRELHQQDQRTVLVASHGLGEIGSLARRLVLLEEGQIIEEGKTEQVLAAYWRELERERNRLGHRVLPSQPVNPYGEDLGHVKIDTVRFVDSVGKERQDFYTGEPMTVEIWFNALKPVDNPLFRVQFFRNDGLWVHGMNSYRHRYEVGRLEGRGCVRLEYERINLLESDYFVSVGIWPDEYTSFLTDVAYDHHEKSYTLRIQSERHHGAGILTQPAIWSIMRPGEPKTEQLIEELVEMGRLPIVVEPAPSSETGTDGDEQP